MVKLLDIPNMHRELRINLIENLHLLVNELEEAHQRISRDIVEGSSIEEVKDARGNFLRVGDRLRNSEGKIAVKADRSYVQEMLSDLVSGSPQGVYSTLSELENAHPSGGSGIFIVKEDGKWYFWQNGWQAGGVYQSEGLGQEEVQNANLARKAVSAQKTDFIEVSSNLYNDKADIVNHNVHSTTGELVENSDYNTTAYVPVLANAPYIMYGFNRVVFYDARFQYNGTISNISYDRTTPITPPAGSAYVRLHYQKANNRQRQINEGSEKLEYEPYYLKSPDLQFSREAVGDLNLTSKDIPDQTITKEKTDFIFNGSTNLYNKRQAILGKAISSVDGSLISDDNYMASEWIHAEGGQDYSLTGFNRVLTFDADLQLLEFTNMSHADEITITLPAEGRYIRAHRFINSTTTGQINQSSQLLEYEPYRVEVDGFVLTDEEHHSGQSYYFPPEPLVGEYVAPALSRTLLSVAELATAFDELIDTYPDYISKQLLGKDSSGNYDMWQYRMKPPVLENNAIGKELPKIVIQASVHGHERPSTLALYYAVRSICEDWKTDALLEYLRFNVEFVFIAVLNPYGYESGEYKNANGVNIQTNFPVNWVERDPDSNTYGGTEPLTEVEAQYAKAMIDDHTDALYFLDLHANDEMNYQNDHSRMFYILVPIGYGFSDDIAVVGDHGVRKMSRFLRKHYSVPESPDFFGWIRPRGEGPGTTDAYVASLGIPTSVNEHFFRLPDGEAYTEEAIKANEEFLINWLIAVINQFKKQG